MNPQIEISPGELLDRISILALKVSHTTDSAARDSFQRELNALQDLESRLPPLPEVQRLSQELTAVNHRLWRTEDELRIHEQKKDFTNDFIALARSVYRDNDFRAALRKQINTL